MAQIICKDLAVGYDGKAIVQELNFSLNKGDYLCIVGENGSGKSTLMRTLLHLQPPISGNMLMDDELKADEIGYLPQQTQVQKDFPASVREIVLSGCQNGCGIRPFYNKKEKVYAKKTLEKLQIAHLEKRCYRELSGGQQQRVLLARALQATQKVLLMDEPVSSLDPKAAEELYQLIQSLNKQEKITILMISHDIKAAVTYASHILHIGQPVFFGTKQEYLESAIGRGYSDFSGGAED